jgi:hypothetical protein
VITNFDAIRSLFQEKYPTEEFSVTGNMEELASITLSKDNSKLDITQAEVDDRKAVLQAEYDAQAYARNRIYPPIGDQLDDLYHAGVFSADMAAKLKKAKDDNPKS